MPEAAVAVGTQLQPAFSFTELIDNARRTGNWTPCFRILVQNYTRLGKEGMHYYSLHCPRRTQVNAIRFRLGRHLILSTRDNYRGAGDRRAAGWNLLFEVTLEENTPEIWQAFLEELYRGANPIPNSICRRLPVECPEHFRHLLPPFPEEVPPIQS